MVTRHRVSVALVALTAAIALGCVTSASAGAQTQQQGVLGINLGLNISAPYIEGLLNGENQPLDAAGNLLCQAGQVVGGNLPGGEPVNQALCAIPALDYQYVTRFKKSGGGEIVRRHTALVNIPTPLNVDGDLLPDLVATVHVFSLTQFTLRIDRFLTEFSTTPVKVEAIVDDPTAGALPREKINVGYDARSGRAPNSWKATASLPDDGSDALTTLNIVKNVSGAGATITTLGGLFDGDALARKDPMGGTIQYTPVPAQATLGLTLGSHVEVRAGAGTSTNVQAGAEIVEGPREQRVGANINALPQVLSVRMEEPATNQRRVTYAASASVPSLDASYTDSVGGALATKVRAKASAIPTGMILDQTGARAATFTATGGTLGSLEVGFANGEPKLLDATHPYARIFDDGTLKSYAARIDALRSASFDATTKITGELQLGPEPRKKFRALVDIPAGRHIDAVVTSLPRHLKLLYDADGGLIDYNAFGETIDDITAEAQQDAPFFGRVRRVHAKIAGLPSLATVNIKPGTGSGVAFSASPAVGMIQASMTDGAAPEPSLPAGRAGVIMKDVPSEFSVFGRLFNVSGATVTTATNGDFDASLSTGPLPNGGGLQDLDLDVTFDTAGDAVTEPAHIVGFVQDLPATLHLEQHGPKTTYSASSEVPKVTLDARNLSGGSPGQSLDGGLHNAVGTLTGVPKTFTIRADTLTGVEADGAFTRAELEAWDHGPRNAAFPEDDRNKLAMNTRDGRLHVQARVFALSRVLLGTSTTTSVDTAFGSIPKPLDISIDGGTGAAPLDLDVEVNDLPTSSVFTFGQLLGMKIGWTAAAAGTDIGLKVAAKDVGADLSIPDLPASVNVCVGGGPIGCQPKAPSVFTAGDETWIFPNAFTAVTSASDTIRMSGKVCLPPTDEDGEALDPPGTVFGACLDGTSPNRIEVDNLRLKDQRLELASGDTTSTDEDGAPLEDDLLKLWLDGDSGGIRVDSLVVRNDTSDSSTIVRAGHSGGLPLRNSGDHFFLLADMSGIPNTALRDNQMECDDLDVEVDLPVLGLTDVLPSPGEVFLGDVCIDH
jgi:hypothetical protein